MKPCDKCGKPHVTRSGKPACAGHKRDTGDPCKAFPIEGGIVCKVHGGALPIVKEAARRRKAFTAAQGEIAELMRECDVGDQSPVAGLMEVVRVAGSMMRLLAVKVGELDEEPDIQEVLVEGRDGTLTTRRFSGVEGFWGLNTHEEMTPHPFVALLRTWNERYERACKTALDAGIEERTIRLAEQQGEVVAAAMTGLLEALTHRLLERGLPPDAIYAVLRDEGPSLARAQLLGVQT